MPISVAAQHVEQTGYSSDGYVRLTYPNFCRLLFPHRSNILDGALREELAEHNILAVRAGYCDWMDDSTMAQISVSWAWFATDEHAPELLAPGGVNSNIMLISRSGRDLGWSRTDVLLQLWLTQREWRPACRGGAPFFGYSRKTLQ